MRLLVRAMKRTATVWLALFATSCANQPATPESAVGTAPPAPGPSITSRGGKSPGGASASSPAAPAGARYTIYCLSVPGTGHVTRSTQLREQLVRRTGMRDWYVVHGQDESTLYYGYYRAIERDVDAKEAARARADREKIDGMIDGSGGRPFGNAVLVELATADPEAPPQWDLRRAPPGGYWSLQIAAYEGHPDRKKYAVDAVKEFRANGVPAFYYHGPTTSSVCIGTWPKQAVRGELEPAYNDPNVDRPMDQILAQDPGADLIVAGPGLPPVNKDVRTRKGRLRAVSTKLEAVDPTLLGTMKAYPHHYVNGVVEGMRTAQGVQGKPSLLVPVPRQADTLLGGGYDATVAADSGAPGASGHRTTDPGALSSPFPPGATGAPRQPPARSPDQPARRPAQGYGQLRSIEDR